MPIECAYMRAHTLGSERGERIKVLGALGSLGSLEALENLGSLDNLENFPEVEIGGDWGNAECKMQNAEL